MSKATDDDEELSSGSLVTDLECEVGADKMDTKINYLRIQVIEYAKIYDPASLKMALTVALPHEIMMELDPTGGATLAMISSEIEERCNNPNVLLQDEQLLKGIRYETDEIWNLQIVKFVNEVVVFNNKCGGLLVLYKDRKRTGSKIMNYIIEHLTPSDDHQQKLREPHEDALLSAHEEGKDEIGFRHFKDIVYKAERVCGSIKDLKRPFLAVNHFFTGTICLARQSPPEYFRNRCFRCEEIRVTKRDERFLCNCTARPTCGTCGGLHTTNKHEALEKLRLRALHNLTKDVEIKSPTHGGNRQNLALIRALATMLKDENKKEDSSDKMNDNMSLIQHRVSDKVAHIFGISACLYNSMLWMLIDTGACSSAISAEFYEKYLLDRGINLEKLEERTGAGNSQLTVIGSVWLPLFIGDVALNVKFQVIRDLVYPVFRENDFASLASLDYPQRKMETYDVIVKLISDPGKKSD